jgi:riboflavin synthase
MFTGIIEGLAELTAIDSQQSNITFTFLSPFDTPFTIDQSIAHNGVCLTVVEVNNRSYKVTAIEETLSKTNMKQLKIGDKVNLERCMVLGARLDGHIVQGHVDQIAVCISKEDLDGSWVFTFEYDPKLGHVTVEKGSVCVNGTSLTVVNSELNRFSVCIIPYTYEHTVFQYIQKDTIVNIEFDIIGKYIQKLNQNYKS